MSDFKPFTDAGTLPNPAIDQCWDHSPGLLLLGQYCCCQQIKFCPLQFTSPAKTTQAITCPTAEKSIKASEARLGICPPLIKSEWETWANRIFTAATLKVAF